VSSRLFSLFDDRLKTQRDLVASPAQNLESISLNPDEQEYVLKKIRNFEEVRPKVDYTDFANFVFFNSALDYFNITGEKILNEYPYDGSRDRIQSFIDDLDGYQQYVLEVFPRNSGHLRFNPAVSSSYISVEDAGFDPITNRAATALLSPGTGSMTLEFWCQPPPALTGSNDVMVALQKVSGSGDGYTVFFSGSSVFFRMVSGSFSDQVSAPSVPGQTTFLSCIYDSDESLVSIVTGSTTEFPVVVSSASSNISERIDLGTSVFTMASGSLSSKVVRPLTGALDDVRVWNYARSLYDTSGSFNVRQYSQSGLVALWLFNETGSIPHVEYNAQNTIVRDHSGHRLDARINRYFSAIRASGSLLPYDVPDPVLNYAVPAVQSFISEQQTSGSAYDRENDNLITRMIPDQFIQLEQFRDTDVLEKFLYILGRQFDYIKIRIDQFLYVLRQNYGRYDQTPDALLAEIGRFFGWEFTGNFLSSDANQYIIGRNVLHNLDANREIEKKLYEIKNEFWKRTLINLMHLYKTKGTRESIESLLRVYGVNRNFVRLKEFGLRPNVGITTERIYSDKSVAAIGLGSGSYSGSAYVISPSFTSSVGAVEVRVRFPTTTSQGMYPTVLSGSIWSMRASTSGSGFAYGFPFTFGEPYSKNLFWLTFEKDSITGYSGSLILSSSEANFRITGAHIFDDKWYNIAFIRNEQSGSMKLSVRSIDRNELDMHVTGVLTGGVLSSDQYVYSLHVGATGNMPAQYWAQEVRVHNQSVNEQEIEDHAWNYQSYGSIADNDDILLHWRMRENVTASAGGVITQIEDVSSNYRHGTANGLAPSQNPYKKFLNEYNFIASPEFGWTERLVRVLDTSEVKPEDAFTGNKLLALEFNMIDALNEDISQIISSLENFNYAIGLPANRYRESYKDLETMRKNYFKRLQGRLNFRVFADMLDFFDRSFIDMVRRLIPTHSYFIGDQFVVESHMLERPKHQWEYRRQERTLYLEGRIQMYERR
jgi:hypothetical protein